MAPNFADIVRSEQFTFLLGEDQTPITVHATALAATSAPMDRLINGQMKEANSRCAELRDISVEDFVRFCEYAYRGDYATPAYSVEEARFASKTAEVGSKSSPPDHYEESPEPATSEVVYDIVQAEEASPADNWFGSQSKKTKKPSKKSIFRTNYQSREYLSCNTYEAEITDRFKTQSNTADEQDFTPVFIAHAQLYTFARMRLVDNLKALTLDKLHKTLVAFRLYENRVGDIVELARYAYSTEDIPGRADDGKIDELRDLIVNYIVSEFDVIGKAAIFVTFLEEGGEFVGDFFGALLKGLL